MKFKEYINFNLELEKNKVIYVPENFSWVKSFSLPDIDLKIPQTEKKSSIQLIMDKKNPIYIQLSDGSRLFFTFDEFKRILGKPAVGKTMIWRTQRLQNDPSSHPSKITMCKVI